MMRTGKPHLYKVENRWYCKCVVADGTQVLGPARPTHYGAYASFKVANCHRGGINFQDEYPFDMFRF